MSNSVPRVCGGDPCTTCIFKTNLEVFPAYAGVIPQSAISSTKTRGVPRVCGGDPCYAFLPGCLQLCSPRMRG